jgi:CheY-like chemotaxis protein/phosphoribosyl 1,2-cyclic phosphodiesterase
LNQAVFENCCRTGDKSLKLRFWGTRGSIATPGPLTTRYGGNTSCVEVVTSTGQRFIFDCGTGARPLGVHLMEFAPKPISATLFLSHTHWDHIQGFPFFGPFFVPGNDFTVCAPLGAKSSLTEVLSGQMEFTYFPVELAQLGATISYKELVEGTYAIGGVRVSARLLNHPAAALGYRIEADGASLLYICDHEPFWETLWASDAQPGRLESILHAGDCGHAAFLENADLVIHESQYTPEEYPAKKNWGHSPFSYVVGIAAAAKVKRLFLTHHDPSHDDAFLDRVEQSAREMLASLGSSGEVSCAREGFETTVGVDSAGTAAVAKDDVHAVDFSNVGYIGSLLVLIVDDDEDLRIVARTMLVRAGHRVLEASSGTEGLALIARTRPDLLMLDLDMPDDGFEILRQLRSTDKGKSVPVIVLTAHSDEESTRRSFELGATDFLAKPFTSPQLDSRVRACFAHASR